MTETKKAIEVRIGSHLSLALTSLSEPARADIQRAFRHSNPQHAKMKRMGYAAMNEPKHYDTYKFSVEKDRVTMWRGTAKRLKSILDQHGYEVIWRDQRLRLPPTGLTLGNLVLQPDQELAVQELLKWQQGLLRGNTGSGKCLGKGTPVLMFDGSIKPVEEIQAGELVMGPDSKPRLVTSISQGRSELYKIKPTKGEEWVCNGEHILYVRRSDKGDHQTLSVNEYLRKSKTYKQFAKLVRANINFRHRKVPIDPYYLGAWLGDGRYTSTAICKPDLEIRDAVKKIAEEWGLNFVAYDYGKCPEWSASADKGQPNALREALNICRVRGEKRIPKQYLINSRKIRLEVLAGLLDTDGHQQAGGFEFSTKYVGLKDDVLFLCRSLGFAAYESSRIIKEKIYWRVSISGDCSEIPTRIERKKASPRKQIKDVLVTGFEVEALGIGDYYGFTLDGDHLFCLGDFTITHNTEMMLAAAVLSQQPTLIQVWNKGLLKQWQERIVKWKILPAHKIGVIQGSKRKLGPITIAMVQTLNKHVDQYRDKFGCVILDECQRSPATTFTKSVIDFPAKYRWGATADEVRRDRKEFLAYEVFGYQEWEERGNTIRYSPIAEVKGRGQSLDPTVIVVPTRYLDPQYEDDRNYGQLINRLVAHQGRNEQIATMLQQALRKGRQIILFTERVDAAKYWVDYVSGLGFTAGPLIGGLENQEETEATLEALRKGSCRFAATTTYADVGLDVPSLDCAFVTCPTAGNIKRLHQQIGRIVRPHEGKKEPIAYYFWDKHVGGISKGLTNIKRKWTKVIQLDQ